jgi:hypothetical protein
MSSVLIVGHCKPGPECPHETLYEEKEGIFYPLNSVDYLDIGIRYLPQEGEYKLWNTVPRNSKDILYTWKCPLYLGIVSSNPLYGECKEMWKNLLTDGYEILRPSGKIIIPTTKNITPLPVRPGQKFHVITNSENYQIQNIERIIREIAPDKWTVKYYGGLHLENMYITDKPHKRQMYPCIVLKTSRN